MAVITVLVLLVNLSVNPWLARYRSLAVMTGYDWSYERDSLPRDAGVRVDMPLSASGYYPRMITFNADQQMSAWLGVPVRFTVDFTFGDFEAWAPHSSIFDPDDARYGAYVGSYFLAGLGRPLTAREVAQVAEFDQRQLALPALGLGIRDNHFDVLESVSAPATFAGHDWTGHDAVISTNCPDHSPDGFHAHHLQFGRPPATSVDYPVCQMLARIEVTYLADRDVSVGLYIMAASLAELDRLSELVVRRAALTLD